MKKKLQDLVHVTRPLKNGGMVLILNTGAVIDAEAEAMLQALHSRSSKGVLDHLKILIKKGASGFMKQFYINYGHKSIGDCGTITIFIEKVSMLVAKAIQDSMLYSGQEASTRYIDFSEQMIIDPVGTEKSNSILEEWRTFYLGGVTEVNKHLQKTLPIQEGDDEKEYERAIKARTFDIMRSFLPAGTSTNLSWHSNLRQIADHLAYLRYHPLEEVRQVAEQIESALTEYFPSSFPGKKYHESETYRDLWMKEGYLYKDDICPDSFWSESRVDKVLLAKYRNFLSGRPSKTDLPKKIGECGTMRFKFLLDFGSFRDIQRHRAVVQLMPLVTMQHGIHDWYLQQLPDNLRKEALDLIKKQELVIKSLQVTEEIQQYYIPMGYKIPCVVVGDLPSIVYLTELRGTRFVHPTLSPKAHLIADFLREEFKEFDLALHMDDENLIFDVRRGSQTIILKPD